MTSRAQLHLVNAEGKAVSPTIEKAVEEAFRWVIKDFPDLDRARIADWAEGIAVSMQLRGSAIENPERYAYAALKGKVRDWFRTRSAQEQSAGIGGDLERLGGSTRSFQGTVERKILFDQVQASLADRDCVILLLLLNEKSAQEVAAELKTSYPAARKAIQRVKERIAAILGSNHPERGGGRGTAQFCESKG